MTNIIRGSSLYYGLLFVEQRQKVAVTALLRFYREIRNIADKRLEPHVGLMKLSWWSTEIDRTYKGTAQHPLTQALVPIIQQYSLPEEGFQQFLEGIKIEIDFKGFESKEDFFHFLQLRAGVDRLFSQILTQPSSAIESFVSYWSISLQLIDFIRFFGKDLRQGIVYFPKEDLNELEINQTIDRHIPAELLNRLLTKEGQRAQLNYEKGLTYLNKNDRKALAPMLILGNIQITLLNEIAKEYFSVLNQKISLTPLRKYWIAWRTQIKETF